MKINDIFYENKYDEAYQFVCNNQPHMTIIEIESDENGRRFQIVEVEPPTPEEIARGEYLTLKEWFETYYTQHEQKYRRLHTLGQKCDNGADPYNELVKLYEEAETKRKRIQEIKELIK